MHWQFIFHMAVNTEGRAQEIDSRIQWTFHLNEVKHGTAWDYHNPWRCYCISISKSRLGQVQSSSPLSASYCIKSFKFSSTVMSPPFTLWSRRIALHFKKVKHSDLCQEELTEEIMSAQKYAAAHCQSSKILAVHWTDYKHVNPRPLTASEIIKSGIQHREIFLNSPIIHLSYKQVCLCICASSSFLLPPRTYASIDVPCWLVSVFGVFGFMPSSYIVLGTKWPQ